MIFMVVGVDIYFLNSDRVLRAIDSLVVSNLSFVLKFQTGFVLKIFLFAFFSLPHALLLFIHRYD